MSAPASLAVKKQHVLSGKENREQLIVDASEAIQYIAQSFPGADPTEAVWLCQKITSSGSDYPYLKTVQTYPVGENSELAAPGTDGADLATLFGD